MFLNQFVAPFNYSNDDSGIMGAVLIFSGIIATVFVGFIADRYKSHVLIIKCLWPVIVVGYLFFALAHNHRDSLALICVACGIIGIASMGILPAVLELAAAVTARRDVGEGMQ